MSELAKSKDGLVGLGHNLNHIPKPSLLIQNPLQDIGPTHR